MTDETNSPLGNAWWIDEPLSDLTDDQLGRAPFVHHVVQLLKRVTAGTTSAVVALTGPWGSGKSSTVGMIRSLLEDAPVTVRSISPWSLAGPERAVSDLLAVVSQSLPEGRARRSLLRYAAAAVPLLSTLAALGQMAGARIDPLLALFGGAIGEAAASEAQDAVDDALAEGTVQQRLQAVTVALQEVERPLLVIVDDVDRLQPDELLALFKAIRVVGRLPNVHYLLVYDQTTLLDVLSRTEIAKGDRPRALAFVDKVVTLRLEQPPVTADQMQARLVAGLGGLLTDLHVVPSSEQTQRLGVERESLFGVLLTEPRAAARFLGQLRTYLPLVGPNEVDVVDFAVLSLLRLRLPDLYQQLTADLPVLTAQPGARGEGDITPWLQGGVVDAHVRDAAARRAVQSALERLLPLLADEDAATAWRARNARFRARRFSDPDHSARYLALQPPADTLSEADVLKMLGDVVRGRTGDSVDRLLAALRPEQHDAPAVGRIAPLLRRALRVAERWSGADVLPLIALIFEVAPFPYGAGTSGPRDAAAGWLRDLLSRSVGVEPQVVVGAARASARPTASVALLVTAVRGLTAASAGVDLPLLTVLVAEAAWERVRESTLGGARSLVDESADLLRWLSEVFDADDLRERLTALLRDGADVLDLASRFVSIGVDVATGEQLIVDVSGADVLDWLGREHFQSRYRQVQDAARGFVIDLPLSDVSWHARRRTVAQALLPALQEPVVASWAVTEAEAGPLLNHRNTSSASSDGPAVHLRMSVLTPPAALPPGGQVNPQSTALVWEDRVPRLLEESPLGQWVAPLQGRDQTKASWHITSSDWPRSLTARAGSDQPPSPVPEGGDARVRAEVRIDFCAITPSSTPTLLISVDVGIWLATSSSHRRPGETRHPVPRVVMPLPLLGSAVSSLFASVPLIFELSDLLFGNDGERPSDGLLVDLTLQTSAGLQELVGPTHGASTVPAPSRGEHRRSLLMTPTAGLWSDPTDIVTAQVRTTLARWLEEAGFRNIDGALDASLEV